MKIIQTFFIASLCFSAVVAASKGPRGLRDVTKMRRLDKSEPKERECEIERSDDDVKFKCKSKTEDDTTEIKDKISFEVKSDNRGLVVKVEYEQEIETAEQETETETDYEIFFDRIIEYQKGTNSSDQAYDWENDGIVNEVLLQNWDSLGEITDSADGVVSTFSISSSDGLATFTFYVSRADDGEAITANKMKIDFELKSYPWAQAGDTYVALLCAVESKREVEVEYEEDDDSEDDSETKSKRTKDVLISFADAETSGVVPFGEYTWANTAMARDTNTTIDVIATSPQTTNATSGAAAEERIAFSFVGSAAQGDGDIYWDPEAGVAYRSSAFAASRYLGIVLALASMIAFV